MNWKRDLKLADLAPEQMLEVTCRRCGLTRYESPQAVMAMPTMRQAYVDEAERALKCSGRFCRGPVRVSLIYDDKTEGFVGGLA